MSTAPYERRRRTRASCVAEFLLVSTIFGLVGLAILGYLTYLLIQATSVSTAVFTIATAVAAVLGLLVLIGIWALEHWDGQPWKWLANSGRSGDVATVTAADGVPLHVEIDGVPEAPVTVVFCHGIATNASIWQHQRFALVRIARRVSYDARGHGKSGTGKLNQSIPGVRQLADDLGRVIDAAAPTGPLVLAGHGMGGLTVLALGSARPDIIARVEGYVLCSTTAGPLRKSMTFGLWRVHHTSFIGWLIFAPLSALMRRQAAGLLLVFDVLPRFMQRLCGIAPYLVGVRLLAVHRRGSKVAVRPGAAIVFDNGFRQSGDLVNAIQEHDERPGLKDLANAHVAVIGGENDRLVPRDDQDSLAENIPGATLTEIEKCGYLTLLENPEVVNAELKRIVGLVIADNAPPVPADSEDGVPEKRSQVRVRETLAGLVTSSVEYISAPARDGIQTMQKAFHESAHPDAAAKEHDDVEIIDLEVESVRELEAGPVDEPDSQKPTTSIDQ